MSVRRIPELLPAVLIVIAAVPALGQVTYSGEQGRLPFAAGPGISSYDVDWGHGRIWGGTAWADWGLTWGPNWMQGFGLEGEARYINLGHSPGQPPLKVGTAGGGPIYTWRHFQKFRPYGKFLMSYGSLSGFSFPTEPGSPPYTHDTRTAFAPGGGLEFRLTKHVWLRVDYEYQFWMRLFLNHQTYDPQGFTMGAMYNLRDFHRH
jgi:opacity protein-like surface antigen